MEFRTVADLPEESVRLTPRTQVMLIGSCFSEYVGERMQHSLPDGRVSVNPFGVMYNPASIMQTLRLLETAGGADDEALLFAGSDGLWRNWLCSGKHTADSRSGLAASLRALQAEAVRRFRAADCLFVTFSTDHAYRLAAGAAEGLLVANCHKQPGRMFREEVLDLTAQHDEWAAFLGRLKRQRPEVRVVFTLSPYRYAKYGLHESNLGKARLLCLIDALCREFDTALYFPAYEIVVDELRDYRFYKPDMLHPSEQAVDYVWERFRAWAFTPEMADYARDRQALLRDRQHRLLHPDSDEAHRFEARRAERERLFVAKWGQL